MTTQLNIAANEPGVYQGENTQFNGDGFQRQHFPVLALSPADYDHWLAGAKAQSDNARYGRPTPSWPARSTVPHPEVFGSVEPGLFQSVLDKDKPDVRSGSR